MATARIESHLTVAASVRQIAPTVQISGPELLAGRYRILETLGSGGVSRTYLAQDSQRPGMPSCVVKQLRSVSADPEALALARRLFQREAQVQETLKHPQIPQLLAYFEENQEFYLVQEYVEGALLSDELGYEPISEPRALSLLWDLLPVLDYLHQRQVIHRDIKPHNIIRRQSTRRLVLIDFGTVKDISGLTPGNPMTVAIGTLGYAPVEQCAGHPRFNSDLYALGMVAVQGITGLTPAQLLQEKQPTGEIHWQQYGKVSPGFMAILDKMIHPNWTQRYQSAYEVMQDLRPLVAQWRERRAERAQQTSR